MPPTELSEALGLAYADIHTRILLDMPCEDCGGTGQMEPEDPDPPYPCPRCKDHPGKMHGPDDVTAWEDEEESEREYCRRFGVFMADAVLSILMPDLDEYERSITTVLTGLALNYRSLTQLDPGTVEDAIDKLVVNLLGIFQATNPPINLAAIAAGHIHLRLLTALRDAQPTEVVKV